MLVSSDGASRLSSNATIISCLRLERSEVLKNLDSDITCRLTAKNSTLSIALTRGRKKSKPSTTFLERTKKGHGRSSQHLNCFKVTFWSISYRRGGTHKGFPDRLNAARLALKLSELIFKKNCCNAGQNIAMHASPTARNFFLERFSILPIHSPTFLS